MRLVYGVDSADSSEVLWDIAVKELGRAPAFWGRYLTDGHVGATPLTQKEVEFLHARRCKIVLIYNAITKDSCQTGDQAERHAYEATRLAKALGVPEGVTIFGDIEHGWAVTETFQERWEAEMLMNGYCPGLYLPIGLPAPSLVKLWRPWWIGDISLMTAPLTWIEHWDIFQYASKEKIDLNVTIENNLPLWAG